MPLKFSVFQVTLQPIFKFKGYLPRADTLQTMRKPVPSPRNLVITVHFLWPGDLDGGRRQVGRKSQAKRDMYT